MSWTRGQLWLEFSLPEVLTKFIWSLASKTEHHATMTSSWTWSQIQAHIHLHVTPSWTEGELSVIKLFVCWQRLKFAFIEKSASTMSVVSSSETEVTVRPTSSKKSLQKSSKGRSSPLSFSGSFNLSRPLRRSKSRQMLKLSTKCPKSRLAWNFNSSWKVSMRTALLLPHCRLRQRHPSQLRRIWNL